MSQVVVIWLIVAFVCGLVGSAIGSGKGRQGAGFALGALFGIFGILIIAVMSPTPEAQAEMNEEVAAAQAQLAQATGRNESTLRRCPWCAELIQPAAKICRYCN